ncbi:MAG TPA: hypothetical protein VGM30_20850 [Puia sp.]|jgi:hypothetical protein
MSEYLHHPASYRDPSGFVFRARGLYYRQVNRSYAADYELLFQSGLYSALTARGWLIPHTEVDAGHVVTGHPDQYKILLPEQLSVISYPGEWSPCQLKDAALLTLQIMHMALDHGMILKDATPLNIQFRGGSPVFIDTLSFERYDPSLPWIAYRQFCECFLFPLYLQHYLATGVHKIMSAWPEGIPASVTARLLPLKSRLRGGVWLHVLLPGKVSHDRLPGNRTLSFNKNKLLHLTGHLRDSIQGLNTSHASPSTWNNYYRETIISSSYLAAKETLFRTLIADIDFRDALDLGANDGYFSKILAERSAGVVAVDSDWQCINNLYQFTRQHPGTGILPLCVDIADPTPATGFNNAERASFTERMPADLVVALALLHHLVLGRNIPLEKVAAYFALLSRDWLLLEFIPLTDIKAVDLVRNKKGVVPAYDAAELEKQFGRHFTIDQRQPITGTERILYRMRKNTAI